MRSPHRVPVRCVVAGLLLGGCIAASPDDADPCVDTPDCESNFGGGSICEMDGYCSEPDQCEVDEDCAIRFGDEWLCVLDEGACFVGGMAPDRGRSADMDEPPSQPEVHR